ncbi:hypothetical protein M407DRAFT_24217 [Tulasnella calospora MUT 4182]|uniref:Uncharacterized protein n=1 Tax=Tulasnella calospora MUT 4182 TaxID=1051891 RepID=A0A0C3QI88_9AGAM|nr:hypothetical protein M407DRAFT_24217 [Tulasnella calospora MUT 4182]
MTQPETTEDIIKHYAGLIIPKDFNGIIDQPRIVDDILGSGHLSRYPPSKSFQLQFLKAVISRLESTNEEVDDNIYGRYLELLAAKPSAVLSSGPPEPSYVTHFYKTANAQGPPKTITLLESRTTIEAGTTGLRTWQAAFVFANWLLQHPGVVKAKKVLELGSGTGFLGILAAQLQAAMVLTDCNAEVLERCKFNVFLDCTNHPSITIRTLDWNDCLSNSLERDAAFAYLHELAADVIIGTDLVFDPSIIPALVATLRLALDASASSVSRPQTEALIALAIRRESTFAEFKAACNIIGLSVEEESLDGAGCGPFTHNPSRSTSLNVADHVSLLRIRLFGTREAKSGPAE